MWGIKVTGITSLSQFLNNQTNSGSSTSTSLGISSKSAMAVKNATGSATTTADGDTITLSAKAQALLDKNNAAKKNYGFTLTDKQQEQLQSVLDKYKDKPQTQDNYDAIQKDLKKYRLDLVNMSAKESAKSFSLKGIMLSIMNGKDVSNGTTERAQALATKKSAYAEQIVADWAVVRATAAATATTETE